MTVENFDWKKTLGNVSVLQLLFPRPVTAPVVANQRPAILIWRGNRLHYLTGIDDDVNGLKSQVNYTGQ
jgi:hypothetical protein